MHPKRLKSCDPLACDRDAQRRSDKASIVRPPRLAHLPPTGRARYPHKPSARAAPGARHPCWASGSLARI
eukprot:1475043-Prymnesium_polylepis.1